MAQVTKIEWTDVSWNPVHGCSRVSTGCKNCYAETLSLRHGQTKVPWTERNAAENVMLKPHKLREPLSKAGPWKQPCRVFVNSMSDLFHEQIPDEYIARVWAVMAEASQHTFQVLTKRPERMRDVLRSPQFWEMVGIEDFDPLPHIWLGVSIENRKWVGRADVLRATPAAVRFISAEPLLGPLIYDTAYMEPGTGAYVPCWVDTPESGYGTIGGGDCRTVYPTPELDLTGIDWLIVGGESGSGHRPFDPQWARGLRDACRDSGTAYFFKQMGGARPGTKLEDLPEDLRIREFPA
ncbi:MAG: phage Gp37/Gp68 family protein [Chloroflexi bacterium]|nr:phage Gp37/Gp68 family protein [Chloroflexota bacterium]